MAINIGADKQARKQTDENNRFPLEVNLVGESYRARAVKAITGLRLATASNNPEDLLPTIGNVLKNAMGEEHRDRILERLDDPEDNLDIEQVAELINALIEAGSESENPTG